MKKIIPIQDFEFEDDIKRIVEICVNAGYAVSENDACQIWEDYSESMAAGWMSLPSNDNNVLDTVLAYSRAI